MTAGNDNVDSADDVEDFTLIHSVTTSDAVYLAKATNLTVKVRVQDDDTAGVVLINPDIVLALIKGNTAGDTFAVTVRPLIKDWHDVTLQIISSLLSSSLMTIDPATIVVPKDDWKNIGRVVTVKALKGKYNGNSSVTITISPSSMDPKYNDDDAKITKTGVITFTTMQPSLVGVPQDQQRWTEGGLYKYSVRLSESPALGVSVTVGMNVKGDGACLVSSAKTLTFDKTNWNAEQVISILTSDDQRFLAKDSVSYSCAVTHAGWFARRIQFQGTLM